ncbi:MAG: hypothetical protein ACRD8Z_14800 [Nitrososphaeraceae archaeon]
MPKMLFALQSPETRRQYLKRLKVIMDYLKLQKDIKEQSCELLRGAFEDPKWLEILHWVYSVANVELTEKRLSRRRFEAISSRYILSYKLVTFRMDY